MFVLVVHPRQHILTTKHGVSVGPGLSTVKTSAQVRVLHNATGIATKILIAIAHQHFFETLTLPVARTKQSVSYG